MAKPYSVRAGQRISVRYPFLYHGEGFHGKGQLWDLSASGWRSTGDHPVTQGMVMPVSIELPHDKGKSTHLLVESAMVRWSNGLDAGWKIQKIDKASRARLTRFLDQLSSGSAKGKSR